MIALHFGFGAVEAEFWRWLFLMTRIGAGLLAAPFFGAINVPPQARVAMTGAIAALVAVWIPVTTPPALLSLAGLMAVLGEVLIGLTLGFVLQFTFAAPTIAAEIIGGGMGMSMATAVDPNSGAHSPALGQYFAVVLTLVFLGLGGHLQWIALLVKSYTIFPPGHVLGVFGPHHFTQVLSFASIMFATAAAMALPVTLVLLLVQMLSGVLSRSAPALNLFSLALPAGIIAGFAALLASAPLVSDTMTQLTADAIAATAELLTP